MSKKAAKQLNVTLVRSPIGSNPKHKATLLGLGLRKINQTVSVVANAPTLGMINKIQHLIRVEEL